MDDTPESVAITNDGLLGFIALRGGKIAMFDLIAHRLVYTVVVGGTPHIIITGLYPPPVELVTPTPGSNAISSQQTPIPQMFWVIVFFASMVTVVIITMILVWQLRQSLKIKH